MDNKKFYQLSNGTNITVNEMAEVDLDLEDDKNLDWTQEDGETDFTKFQKILGKQLESLALITVDQCLNKSRI